jgi:hypothetical protein
MPIYSHTQSFPNSCGAASLVVAIAELQNLPAEHAAAWMSVTESTVYSRISLPAGSGYSWPGLIYQEVKTNQGRAATICEDTSISGALHPTNPSSPFSKAYQQHTGTIPKGVKVSNQKFGAGVFQNGARVMLAMIRPGNALHYILGRMGPSSQLTAMDPACGDNAILSDASMRSGAFFSMNTKQPAQLMFSGIYVIIA